MSEWLGRMLPVSEACGQSPAEGTLLLHHVEFYVVGCGSECRWAGEAAHCSPLQSNFAPKVSLLNWNLCEKLGLFPSQALIMYQLLFRYSNSFSLLSNTRTVMANL